MLVFILLLLIVNASACAYRLKVTDSLGNVVVMDHPARRIVTLSPHSAELVFAAGADAYLVGVVTFSDYPEAASRRLCIGDASRINREVILNLHPDLIIAWPSGNRPQDLVWLEQQGLILYRSDPKTLDAIASDILAIGQISAITTATRAAAAYTSRLLQLRKRYAHNPRRTVFYQIWSQPLITLGSQHLINQVILLCGGQPLFPELSGMSAIVSKEAVIIANPDVIVADATGPGPDPFLFWRHWKLVTAVSHHHLISIPAALLQRPTPRILQGALQLCTAL